MYSKLRINDFRQFKDVEIKIGKLLTVFAGKNSTGKSTILGILANSGELKKKDGLTYLNRQFRAEYSEIFHGSKKFDKSGSDRIEIYVVDNEGKEEDYRNFRTSWQKSSNGKDRFRVIPSKKMQNGKITEAKMKIPVLYLGLSRLFPIGEAEENSINSRSTRFIDDKQKEWFVHNYRDILSLRDDINDVNDYTIGETDKKRGVGIETCNYDYLTNSAGQDNLGQILLALLSFKKLKGESDEWSGGMLLIDELDAALHPSAQKRLVKLLLQEAKQNEIQIVFTTHSAELLKFICEKTVYNLEDQTNNIEMCYFTNANRRLDILRNPMYSVIENDLFVQSSLQTGKRVKVYSEDAENRWFISKLVPELLPYIDLLDVSVGCSQLISLYGADVQYFGNTLIVFDGDVKESDIAKIPDPIRKRMNNIIKLPGKDRPEEVLYNYIISLDPDHKFWDNARNNGFTWEYFNECGPLSDSYKNEKERDRYKAWFKDHKTFFDSTNIMELWKEDNESEYKAFKCEMIKSYNDVAKRNFAHIFSSVND